MSTQLTANKGIQEQVLDIETGLTLVGNSYKSESGFKFMVGLRTLGSLQIIEGVAKGTAVDYLCGIRVFDENNELVIDIAVNRGTRYEREIVRKLVAKELLHMLNEANQNNEDFDYYAAQNKIDEELKLAYYRQSYEAINRWAKEIGIIK